MIRTRQLLIIFIPALLLAMFGLFIKIIQYEPLFLPQNNTEDENTSLRIPISADDFIMGNKKAPLTIIAFEDFSCEACHAQDAILEELVAAHPDRVKIVWKGLPIAQFPYNTEAAHEYSYCAGQQNKFPEFKKFAFVNFDNLNTDTLKQISKEIALDDKQLNECLAGGVGLAYANKNKQLAEILQIQSLPALFIDNTQISPPQSLSAWEEALSL